MLLFMPLQLTAPHGQEFILQDGRKLKTLQDLYAAIAALSDEELTWYMQRGDFSRWIEHSLDEKFLAARVRRAGSRSRLRKELFMAMHR